MFKPYIRALALILLTATLFACGGQEGSEATTVEADNTMADNAVAITRGGDLAPDEVLMDGAAALQANDLQAFLKISLPAEKYAELEAQWAAMKAEPISAEEKAQYKKAINQLTQEGAVDKIMTQLKPQLAQMKQQMPMMIGMMSGAMQMALAKQTELTPDQRAHAQKVVGAISEWAMKTNFASPELAREAVTIAVETANELELPTLESVNALSFEQALAKGGTGLAGIKGILAVYGLNLDATLDSMEAETVSKANGEAMVKAHMEFLGTDLTQEIPMVKKNGQWIAKGTLELESKVAEAQAEEAVTAENEPQH